MRRNLTDFQVDVLKGLWLVGSEVTTSVIAGWFANDGMIYGYTKSHSAVSGCLAGLEIRRLVFSRKLTNSENSKKAYSISLIGRLALEKHLQIKHFSISNNQQ